MIQKLIFLLAALAAAGVSAIRFVHMLQLSSYQFGQYKRYLQTNANAAFGLRRAEALLALLNRVSVMRTYHELVMGVLDPAGILLYVVIAFIFLVFTTCAIEKKRG